MKRHLMFRLTSVGLLIATGMVGCSPTMRMPAPKAALADYSPSQFADHAAQRASTALAAHDFGAAINAAQIAVASAPDRTDYRALLGQAYLAAGQFGPADELFTSVLQSEPANGKASFGHVLALIGQGRTDQARAALAALPATTPAADRGLALALVGDRTAAIALLDAAARQPGADARTRQNLALAYALSGDWARASATAQQDVPAADLPARLAGWAQFASARNSADQVAMLLGNARTAAVPQPSAGSPVQMAAAPALPIPPTELPASPVAVAVARASVPVSLSPAAPVVAAPPMLAANEPAPFARAPLIAAAAAPRPLLLRADPAPYKRSVVIARAATFAPASAHYVVQLGAFRDAARVERAWAQSTARLARLATYTPSSTTFSIQRAGMLTRLSIAGFGTRNAAVAVCAAVKQVGGTCFVRAQAGDNPVRWASRDSDKRA